MGDGSCKHELFTYLHFSCSFCVGNGQCSKNLFTVDFDCRKALWTNPPTHVQSVTMGRTDSTTLHRNTDAPLWLPLALASTTRNPWRKTWCGRWVRWVGKAFSRGALLLCDALMRAVKAFCIRTLMLCDAVGLWSLCLFLRAEAEKWNYFNSGYLLLCSNGSLMSPRLCMWMLAWVMVF